MTEAVITIPYLLPRDLSPNARVHWARKASATRQLKQDAFFLAKEARLPRFTTAIIHFTFVVPDSRARDPDNYLIMMKPAVDGLVAAGIFPNDSYKSLKYAPVVFRPTRKQKPCVIVEIHGQLEMNEQSQET